MNLSKRKVSLLVIVIFVFQIISYSLPKMINNVKAEESNTIMINFQPEGADIPEGYTPDYGRTYAERNGYTYGWNSNHTYFTRDRNGNADQKLDTLCHFYSGGVWEIEVDNGTYEVLAGIGDASYSSTHTLNVEGENYWDSVSLSPNEFLDETKTITVSDGKLTLDQGALAEQMTRINYIEISPVIVFPQGIKINFQPTDVPIPSGYTPDYGDTYGSRNGYDYGWNSDHTSLTRDRGQNTDQKLDTICHLWEGAKWEIAVENGQYDVRVSIGDAGYSSEHTINVEGENYWDSIVLAANDFRDDTKTVSVSDGKLTIDCGNSGIKQTRINYIEIVDKDPTPTPTATPTATPTPTSTPIAETIKVNFQDTSASTPSGYIADTGETYGSRNGYKYGWNCDHTDLVREREQNSNVLLDTLCHFKEGAIWEIELANGEYNVMVNIGDADNDSTHTIKVEGTIYWDSVYLDENEFLDETKPIEVNDGKLTIDQGSLSNKSTRINYIEIMPSITYENDFLIVVSSPLYQKADVATAVDIYKDDLEQEGWNPALITVNNVTDPQADYIVSDAQDLKSIINCYYLYGSQGFVFIGSDPQIPTAFWKYDGEPPFPTDLFYADMSDWGDPIEENDYGENAYKPYDSGNDPALLDTVPELFYGRITSGGISSNIDEEADYISDYLAKLHNYRVNGSNLTDEQQKRSLVFYEGDQKERREDTNEFRSVFNETHQYFDDSLTTGTKLSTLLEEGYFFGQIRAHAYPQIIYFDGITDKNIHYPDNFTIEVLEPISPKVHYLHLYCCNTCRWQDWESGEMPNLGETFLFKNDYVLNINGSTGPWGMSPNEECWSQLTNGVPIGVALKEFITDIILARGVGTPKASLLGDPALVYDFTENENSVPHVTTDLSGGVEEDEGNLIVRAFYARVRGYSGVPFLIETNDIEGDYTYVELTGLPQGAQTRTGDGYFEWIPSVSDVGEIYSLEVKAYNKDSQGNIINTYKEEFTVDVHEVDEDKKVSIPNGGFEEVENGDFLYWNTESSGNSEFSADSTIKFSGTYAGKISSQTPSDARYHINMNLKPTTHYLLTAYVKAEDVIDVQGEGKGAHISIDNYTESRHIIGDSADNDWEYLALSFITGDDGNVTIRCRLGHYHHECTGTAWFDDVQLYEIN